MKNLIGSGGGGSNSTSTPDNLFSEDVVEFALALSEGPVRGLEKGAQSFLVGDTPLVAADGTTKNFDKFSVEFHQGLPEGQAKDLKLVLGGTSSNSVVAVTLLSGVAVTRQTDSVLRNQIDSLEVRILFSRLLETSDKGTFAATAKFSIEYKTLTDTTWKDFYDQHIIEIRGKTSGNYVKEFRRAVDRVNTDWMIRVTKISPDSSESIFVDMAWDNFQAVTKGAATYPNTAIIHGIGTATGQFTSLPEFSSIIEGLMVQVPTNYNEDEKTYDETVPWNGTFKIAWTNNPAWILHDIITNTRYGLAAHRPYVNTDRYDFYEAAKWCDERVASGRPRYTFSDVIQDPRPADELAAYVAGSMNALCLDDNNGNIKLLIDKDDPAVILFTPENTVDDGSGSFTYNFTDITTRVNDITVSFINPDLDWNEDQRRIPGVTTLESNIAKFGRIPLDFIAVGCCNAEEAIRKAAVRLVSSLTETTLVSFTTTRQGALCDLFDVVLIADPTMGWSQSGRILSHDAEFIYFRDMIYIETVKNYTMKIQTLDGIVEVTVQPESLGQVNRLRRIGAHPTNTPSMASFTLEEVGPFGLAKPFRIMSIEEVEGSGYLYRINAVEVNRNKYIDADNIIDIPEYDYEFQDPSTSFLPRNFLLESGADQLLLMPDGSLVPQIHASWHRPAIGRPERYEIQWKPTADAAWSAGMETAEESIYLNPVIPGIAYDVRIRAITQGIMGKSKWANVNSYTVVGKADDAPPPVAAFIVTVKADGTRVFTFSNAGQPLDVIRGGGYQIRYRSAETSTPWLEMTPLHSGIITSSPYESNFPRDGIYDFAISSVDSSGNISATAVLFSDFIIGDADFLDARASTGTEGEAMNQLIAQLNAKIAANKAANAQIDADLAISEITEIASDDVLSSGEKSAVILDYQRLQAEKPGLDAQADVFAVDRTAYDSQFAALSAYLGSLSPAWNNTSTNTPVDGDTFRAEFVDMYTVRQLLQNNIAGRAKQIADAAGAAAAAAQQTAQEAAEDAAFAQASAEAALLELTQIASDNVLSKSEKPQVILDYGVITNERPGIDAQADTYGISRAAYDSSVNSLTSYLQSLSPGYSNLTVDTPIVGTSFRLNFSNVYDARQTLLNAISAKAKQLADTAQLAATNAGAAATTAINTANSAYSQANSALDGINIISNDNILSKGEKPDVYKEWVTLTNEYSGIISNATAIGGVSTTAYTNALTALNNYMASVAVSNYTVDTAITRTVFNQKFYDTYSSRQIVLNNIATRASNIATWSGIVVKDGLLQTGTINNGAATDALQVYTNPGLSGVSPSDMIVALCALNYTPPISCQIIVSGVLSFRAQGLVDGNCFIGINKDTSSGVQRIFTLPITLPANTTISVPIRFIGDGFAGQSTQMGLVLGIPGNSPNVNISAAIMTLEAIKK